MALPLRTTTRLTNMGDLRVRTFHPLVWPVWTLAAGLAVGTNPLHNLVLIAVVTLVTNACHTEGPVGRSFGLFVRLGIVLLAIRLVLSTVAVGGLTFGATRLGTLPELTLPRWLGGIQLGGPWTLEMVLSGLIGGVRLWTLLLVFGAFNAVADQYGLLRRTPRWLFGAGLIVTIGLAWVPQTLLQLQAIREAQRVRGHVFASGWRALRSLVPLAVPLLTGGLERALLLAEAMDSRGYGRGAHASGQGVKQQLGLLVGVVAVALGLFIAFGYNQWAPWGWISVIAGCALIAWTLRRLSRSVVVTRYERDRWQWADSIVGGAAVVVIVSLIVVRLVAPEALVYAVQDRVVVPPFSAIVGGLMVLLALPALISGQ